MSSPCEPGTPAPTAVPANAGLPPGRDPAVLVADRAQRCLYTTRRETDARTAVTRALADYVASLAVTGPAGGDVRLAAVYAEWADPEESEVLPYACVDAQGDQTYDSNSFTPGIGLSQRIDLPPGAYLVHTSNIALQVRVGVWATSREARAAIVQALEDAFWPVEFTGGFRLDMPHYHGARAEFVARRASYEDSAEEALRGYRRAVVTLDAVGPVLRLVRRPLMTVQTPVAVEQAGGA